MKQMMVVSLVVAVTLTAGCGGAPRQPEIGEQFVVEKSRDRDPGWIDLVPEEQDGRMFVTGIASKKLRLEDANTDARMNAIQKVVESMGGTGLVDYTRAREETGISEEEAARYIEDGFRFLARSVSEDTREEEMYRVKMREWTRDGWRYTYDLHLLISVPADMRRMADRGLEQQAAEARRQNNARAEAFANRLRENLNEDVTAP